MNNLKKLLAILLVLHLVLGGASPVFAEFQEETEPFQEETSSFQEESSVPQEETNSFQEEEENAFQEEEEPDIEEQHISDKEDDYVDPVQQVQPQGTSSNGNVGDTSIGTGNAESNGNIFTTANSNLSGNGDCCGNGGIGVVNDGNGTGSNNNGSATVSDTNTTDQSNSANISNGLTGASVSGQNSASNNVGDSYITTGGATTTGTIITSANTNIDGVSVAEFNIVDDHIGDYILDFSAGCVSGCDGFTGLAQNSNNGSNSDNDAIINSDTNNTTNQTNNGTVNNDLYLTANSGDNTASGNTGGDSYITTGGATVVGNVLTFLNNNLSGNVILGVVNIFGDLIGDIILPESAFSACARVGRRGGGDLIISVNACSSVESIY